MQGVNFQWFTCVMLGLFGCIPAFADEPVSELDRARDFIGEMEYQPAIKLIESYRRANPDDVGALNLLAKTYAWDNNFAKASLLYDELLLIEPENVFYLRAKADALSWLQDYDNAIAYYAKAWRLDNTNSEVLRMYILALRQIDNAEYKRQADKLAKIAKQRFPKLHWELLLE